MFSIKLSDDDMKSLEVDLLVDIHAKHTSLQAFIVDNYKVENVESKDVMKYFRDVEASNRADVQAGIMQKYGD